MEMLKDALLSRNIVAWAIIFVIFILCLKFLKSAGKGLLILAGIIILGFILAQFFPGVVAPIADYVNGGWMDD
jgi:hypothetical protein